MNKWCSIFIGIAMLGLPQSLSAQTDLPAPPPGVTIQRDLTFLSAERKEKLDLYRPESIVPGERLPAVVIIHGGGWVKGDKARKREFITGVALAKAGYVAVSVNYQTQKGKRWPGNLHDCKNAVRWLRKNADQLNVDESNIGVIGGSAGGHLALMVAYTPDHPKLSSDELYPGISDRVGACVDMYGITNLLTRQLTDDDGNPTGELKDHRLFPQDREEAPAKWRNASPVNHISKESPPTLILHGTKDTTVDRDQSKELLAALKKAGVESELEMIKGAGHAWPLETKRADLRSKVVEFFDRHLKDQSSAAANKPAARSAEPQQEAKPKQAKQGDHPNVLFIAVDDLNDWQGALGGHKQVKTPNMDQLFKQGTLFTNAHCSQAVCNASRNSVMSGLHPSSSGWYGSTKIMRNTYNDVMRGHVMLPQFFRDSGYHTMAAGKLFHQGVSDYPSLTDKFWDETGKRQKIPKELLKRGDGYGGKMFYPFPKNGSRVSRQLGKDYESGNSLCAGPLDPEDMPNGKMFDELIADWATEKLTRQYDKPFFMAVGFVRPHVPFTAPRKYFDMYNIDALDIPSVAKDEMSDIPWMGKSIAYGRLLGGDHHTVLKLGDNYWRELVLGYLACVSFVDDQIGRVIEALEDSEYRDNTVIVLWSDHGQHLGEKRTWRKQTLWEEATKVPLFFKAPDSVIPPSRNNQVVSLLDIYPTLAEMCGLPKSERLEGESLIPLMKNPAAARSKPVLSSWYYGNFAVRSDHWRYIRYRDGSGELYDHRQDPDEHHNLIDNAELTQVITKLGKRIPSSVSLPAGSTSWKPDTLDKRVMEWEKKGGPPEWLR